MRDSPPASVLSPPPWQVNPNRNSRPPCPTTPPSPPSARRTPARRCAQRKVVPGFSPRNRPELRGVSEVRTVLRAEARDYFMPYDPAQPADHSDLNSQVMRNQLNALNDKIDAVPAGPPGPQRIERRTNYPQPAGTSLASLRNPDPWGWPLIRERGGVLRARLFASHREAVLFSHR